MLSLPWLGLAQVNSIYYGHNKTTHYPYRTCLLNFPTMQCSAARIEADMKRASNEGWIWGAKTVRGAYMHQERALAAEQGYDSPIHDTIQDTHQNYNR